LLLRGALIEIVNGKGTLPPKEQMEKADDAVSDLFRRRSETTKRNKRKPKNKKQYRYAQELYRKNSDLLAKYVREGMGTGLRNR